MKKSELRKTIREMILEEAKNILNEKFEKLHPGKKITEKSPPGWSGTTKAMKKHKNIDNPFALAWWMKNRGEHPHHTPEKESTEDDSWKKHPDYDAAAQDHEEKSRSLGAKTYNREKDFTKANFDDWQDVTKALAPRIRKEVSTSAAAGAFNTPKAWVGGKAADEHRKKKSQVAGYKLTGDDDEK